MLIANIVKYLYDDMIQIRHIDMNGRYGFVKSIVYDERKHWLEILNWHSIEFVYLLSAIRKVNCLAGKQSNYDKILVCHSTK